MSNYGDGNPYNGGGFVQGGSPYGSQESPGGGKKMRSQTLRPVTIKQLIEADQAHNDAEFNIDGHDIGTVLLVGNSHTLSKTATNVSYNVGDGTGYIDVRQWLDTADDESGKMDDIEQDKYVSIIGSIKVFGGKRHVSATHIRAVKDHNEIHHHLLKALYVSLSLRNPGGATGAGGGGASHNDYAAGATNAGAGAGGMYDHLPPIQKAVMEIVAAEPSDEGLHVQVISRSVGTDKGQQVMDAIEQLMQDGQLYSTIDDLHVKAA